MGKSKTLSPTKRAKIVALSDVGMSQVNIANTLGVARKAVQTALKIFHTTGGYKDAPRTGRPRKTTSHDERVMRRFVANTPSASACGVQKELRHRGVIIHRSTV